MIIITLHLVSIENILAYSERSHLSSHHLTFIEGESQKSSLLQHLQEQLTNKNMIFTKNQIRLSNTVGQGTYHVIIQFFTMYNFR